ncbi:MAG: AAA family ATPase [Myxococcales bacterium]|nr:AAA family ATPase [Myxococcales bacterium]
MAIASDRAPASSRPNKRGGEHREVRHIALVTLELAPQQVLTEGERARLARAILRLRPMLDDMAYKRGARWQWTSDFQARAVVGLTARHARAPSDSAWLALETHEALAALADDLPAPVSATMTLVRGIASGIRDASGNLVRYTLHDPVTYLADTLSRKTPPNTTWVAGGLYRLVRREFRWGDAPSLDFPSDTDVPNLRRRCASTRSSAASREERDRLGASPHDLVGRDAEKAELVAAYHAAMNATSHDKMSARAVVGELGIGKTALVHSFLAELPPNARIVRAECSPVRMEVPFATIAELVRSAAALTGEESYAEVVEVLGPAGGPGAKGDNPMVARLAELVTNRPSGQGDNDDAAYQKRLLVTSVRNLLGAFAADGPVVLVAEGLQWADKPSLDVLADLLKSTDPLPILVVLVTRPDERLAPLLEGKVRIELHGLSGDQQVRLVETRIGVKEGVREVCAELLPRVGGNPFFLLELVDALLERGVLEIREDALVRAEEGEREFFLPQTLEQLLADRIEELPPRERRIVDWLAIAGGPLAVPDLERLLAEGSSVPSVATEPAARLCERGFAIGAGATSTSATRSRATSPTERSLPPREPECTRRSASTSPAPRSRGVSPRRSWPAILPAATTASARRTTTSRRPPRRARPTRRRSPSVITSAPSSSSPSTTREGSSRTRRSRASTGCSAASAIASRSSRACARARATSVRLEACASRSSVRPASISTKGGCPTACRSPGRPPKSPAAPASFSWRSRPSRSRASCRELGDAGGARGGRPRARRREPRRERQRAAAAARRRAALSRVLLRRVGRVREAVDDYVQAIAIYRKSGAHRQEARAKNALAYAMFRARSLRRRHRARVRVDPNRPLRGRPVPAAKTLANIGHAYSRLGDVPRAAAYLQRARCPERYADKDGRTDTLLVSAGGRSRQRRSRRGGWRAHGLVVGAAIAQARREPQKAIELAIEARRMAEKQALVAYHFYAFAIEASARVDAGEVHSATLLATTALGAVEALQGSEYGLDVRTLCADALKRAGPQAAAT